MDIGSDVLGLLIVPPNEALCTAKTVATQNNNVEAIKTVCVASEINNLNKEDQSKTFSLISVIEMLATTNDSYGVLALAHVGAKLFKGT